MARPRKRAVGAGAKQRLVFIDWLLATLVHLRHGATHDVLACWFGVDRSTAPPGPSARSGLYWPSEAAPSPRVSPAHARRGHRPPRLQRADRNH
ncbi:helix-turn-helix domain-containing protein [Streptomyces sp. NBC_00069]|uniref:helix-turn-helix domain-containing protein n=1 Tax=Streptomyces sp. NBC_00069 TaxID=2975639 RepID=UPI0032469E59